MSRGAYPQGTIPDPRNDPNPNSAIERLREEIAGQYLPTVSVTAYGATGDGVTDDTAAIQAAITAAFATLTGAETSGTTSNGVVYFPPGLYRITDQITVPKVPGWSIVGAGKQLVCIIQATDNKPIFNLGATGASELHSYRIEGMQFKYTNTQAAANTLANPILFSAMGYWGTFKSLMFNGGTYGIRVASGISVPWGQNWDDLQFGQGLTVGAYSTEDGTQGAPNNNWGRIGVDATTMEGPVFYVRGTNWNIDTLEVFGDLVNAQVWFMDSGQVNIGAIKLEGGTYNGASQKMFEWVSSQATIGTVQILGSTIAPSGGFLTLIRAQEAATFIDIGTIDAAATSITGEAVLLVSNTNARISVGAVNMANGWTLASTGSDVSGNFVTVRDWCNGRLSDNKGDADYTYALSDPTVVIFSTAFTASRTFTLPSKGGNNLCGGLTVKVITAGAVNGANTLVIKEGANTLHTETNDKRAITYTYRRLAWVMTGYETLP